MTRLLIKTGLTENHLISGEVTRLDGVRRVATLGENHGQFQAVQKKHTGKAKSNTNLS